MKKLFVIIGICVLFLSATVVFSDNSQVAAKTGTLTVVVEGCAGDQGFAKIALANSIEGYKDSTKAFMTKKVPISKGKTMHNFKDVPFGEYAVTVYHDENSNNKLDRSFFEKPTEAYGFSNNARGIISSPDYKKAAFVLDKADMTVMICVE